MDDKKNIYRKSLIFILLIMMVLLSAVSATWAWFASGKESKLSNIGMSGTNAPFELEVRGNIVENKSIFAKLDQAFENGEDQAMTPTAYQTSGMAPKIIWRKTGETAADGHYDQGIGPNSHGKLTFWIIPNYDGEISVSFRLLVRGFIATYGDEATNELDVDQVFEVTDAMTATAENGINGQEDLENKQAACDFLRGHILFFSDYDENTGYYSGFLGTGNTLSFAECVKPDSSPREKYGENDTVLVEKGEKYQVTIYWKWANTLEQILYDINSPHRDAPLFSTANQTDRNIAYNFLADERNKVFRNMLQQDIAEHLDNIKNNTIDAESSLSELSSAYNSADLLIGYNIDFIMIELTASDGLD